jgi:phosphotransferase system enzyme I (PtsI)
LNFKSPPGYQDLRTKTSEIKLSVRAVSRGIAAGKAVCLHGRRRQFYRIEIDPGKIDKEVRRFRAAVRLAGRQLKKITVSGESRDAAVNIFEAHRYILNDPGLHEKIEDHIKKNLVNAEWAVSTVTDGYISTYKTLPDEHLREKYIDLEDVADRLLAALGGGADASLKLPKGSIIVAREVKPSTLVELTESEPLAIVTESGGWTSHTFILAREMGIPAVTGARGIMRRVKTGEDMIVDAFQGRIILRPEIASLDAARNANPGGDLSEAESRETIPDKIRTLDGVDITIRVNFDLPQGFSRARRAGAKGIGLYRSEFLFNQFKGFPSEAEQVRAYRSIAAVAGEDGVRIRTFDLTIDHLAGEHDDKEKNPALGLRGIRLTMKRPREFRTQLRSILQAAHGNRIDVVLPMVSDVSEIIDARRMLNSEREKLRRKKIDFGNPRLGAMIEVPSAVIMAEEIFREADFVLLGTNDLVQYLLAVDRDNEPTADWFRTLHPAVLRAVSTVMETAKKAGKQVTVCGEMAGSPVYVPILVGLGATELSMNVNSIARVRRVISSIAFEEAREIALRIKSLASTAEVEHFVRAAFLAKWSHLFRADMLPPEPSRRRI